MLCPRTGATFDPCQPCSPGAQQVLGILSLSVNPGMVVLLWPPHPFLLLDILFSGTSVLKYHRLQAAFPDYLFSLSTHRATLSILDFPKSQPAHRPLAARTLFPGGFLIHPRPGPEPSFFPSSWSPPTPASLRYELGHWSPSCCLTLDTVHWPPALSPPAARPGRFDLWPWRCVRP